MSGRRRAAMLAALAVATAAVGCGDGDPGAAETDATAAPPARAPKPARAADRNPPPPHVARARCPPGIAGCRSASGTIVYVERVDPDGDGDAHFVLASGDSITAPGISVIDVAVDLRPHPLPGPGDAVSAAGPVQTGSYGQSQIHALVLNSPR